VVTVLSLLLTTLAAQGADLLDGSLDLQGPDERRKAVAELAKRKDVSIDDWIQFVSRLGPLPESTGCTMPPPSGPGRQWRTVDDKPGSRTQVLPLLVEGKSEPTELTYYVPHSRDPKKPAPLLLAFHGTGGRGVEVEPMWRAAAEKLGMLVLAPSEAGANEGYAFSSREREAALAALRWMRRNFDVDENRIFATGISRGGHLAWDLALRHPDLFAAIAPMIGGPRFQLDHGQNNLRFLENVVSLPIRDLQGAKDDPGLVANVRLAFARLDKLKAADAKLLEFPDMGHEFDFGAVEWPAFLGSARRNPVPERVVRLAARTDEARAFWVEITKLQKDVAEDVVPKVVASTWNGLNEDGKRKFLEEEVERRTARLEVKQTGLGRFTAVGDKVASFRLLLTASMFDPSKPVQVLFGNRLVEKKATPDARVLLEDFVERFDRTFLPVVAVDVP
jgi:dienelactone hydrolase